MAMKRNRPSICSSGGAKTYSAHMFNTMWREPYTVGRGAFTDAADGSRDGPGGPGGMFIELPAGSGVPGSRRVAVALDSHGLRDAVIDRPVVPASRHIADRIDDIAARDHLAEDRVPTVEVRGRHGGDEELRAVCPRARVGHREQVRPVESQVGMDLVAELVTGTTGTRAERIAALDHEPGDHPVEDGSVVELRRARPAGCRVGPLPSALRELDEVPHRLGLVVREKPDHDRPAVGPQRCCKGIGHTEILSRPGQCPGTHARRRPQTRSGGPAY